MYSLFKEKQRGKEVWVIRHREGNKYTRLPVKKYRHLREDYEALKGYVERLNAPAKKALEAREAVRIKHAFISPALLEEYYDFLSVTIPSRGTIVTEFGRLKTYILDFFVGRLNLTYIQEWKKAETKWAKFLLSEEAPKSAKAKKDIIIAANRFCKWLHEKRPEDTPLVIFKPIPRTMFESIEARRDDAKVTQFIPDVKWKIISKKLPDELRGPVNLMYHYGVRRRESLALTLTDIRKDHIHVVRQVVKIGETAPTKGKMSRKTPHWFCNAKDTYQWVSSLPKIHPRTLSDYWSEFMAGLGMNYTLHDLRHTFITKALRVASHPRDVQMAVGHQDILTTMGYAHDDRDLSDGIFTPDAA